MQDTLSLRRKSGNCKRSGTRSSLCITTSLPEVQDIADLTGDSLELSRAAATMDGEVIVFCGVDFMAETAATCHPKR